MNQITLKQLKDLMDESLIAQEKRLEKRFDTIEKKMVTKADSKQFASKDDLKQFASKDDLKQFASKDDLNEALERAIEDIGGVIKELADQLDEKKAEKEDLNEVEKRVTRLEHKVVV